MAAISTKNVIEDVIVGTYVDNVSPQVGKMRKSVNDNVKQIEGSFKQLGSVIKLAMGGAIGGMVMRQYSQLVQFAKDHNTEAGRLGERYDRIENSIKMAVVSSNAFKESMKAINTLAEAINSAIGSSVAAMDKLGLTFLDFMGPIGVALSSIQKIKEAISPTTVADTGRSADAQAAINRYWKDVTTWQDIYKRSQEALERGRKQEIEDYHAMLEISKRWVGYMGTSFLGSVKHEIDMMEERARVYAKNREEMEKIHALIPKVKDINAAITIRVDKQEEAINRYAETLKARVQEMRAVWIDGWVNAFVSGFQAIGQSIVEGGNVLKAFVANFLSAIGQMAVQFGTMMILYGLAGQAVPFLGISGAAAIAAGAALVVFGGALTALAGSMQKSASGASSQNYRPESSFNEPEGGRQTVVTVVVQALDPSQVGESTLRNLGLRVQKEIDKNQYLGRTVRFA